MRWGLIGAGALAAAVLAGGWAMTERFPVGDLAALFTGGSAKMLCTDVFVAGRPEALAYEQDFRRQTSPGKYLGLVRPRVDYAQRTVSASVAGLKTRTAVYRTGIGCTTADGASVAELRAQGEGLASGLPPPDPHVQWPQGDATVARSPPADIDAAALRRAVDGAFAEPDPQKPRKTRGVVVVHGGRIVAERYAEGFGKETTHLSNSVAKSVTATLVGILVGQGKLNLDAPAPIAEWRGKGDPRGAITLDQLMRMSSGLEFEENYSKLKSDITLQYIGGDLAGYAAAKPLSEPPGTTWRYSTGTSNILGRIVRQAAGPDLPTAFAFPRRALFEPLGMRTAVLEPDAKGNFIGGSSFHASVRDYARLGLLYLRDGVWEGRRILPEGWVDYVRTPTPGSDGAYGAQFWVNGRDGAGKLRWPQLPSDAYGMNGHQGQHVMIVPSKDLVVVRVGQTELGGWSIEDFTAEVIAALRDKETAAR